MKTLLIHSSFGREVSHVCVCIRIVLWIKLNHFCNYERVDTIVYKNNCAYIKMNGIAHI